jgi:cytochrome bd-type quinol oxidase subunit 2
MFETWRAQNAAPPYAVDREALRLALEAEQARARRAMRIHRRGLWFVWAMATGMAIWAAFWIAITITNGWPVIYAITSAVSLVIFACGAGALWVSRGREPDPNFANTLEGEVRRSLALVDFQLSATRRWILPLLGTACLGIGMGLFSWTTNKSQDIKEMSSGVGWFWFVVIFVGFIAWGAYKEREERRQTKVKLEARQRRLREVLAALEACE